MNSGSLGEWHLDKRVPISLILFVLLQAVSTIWFASKLDSRLTRLEEEKILQHETDRTQDQERKDVLNMLMARMDRVDAKLDQIMIRQSQKFDGNKP
jgi:hypothetical protein